MSTITIDNTDWLMRLLSTQSTEVKLNVISRLSASLLSKKRKAKADMSFFDGMTNAWDDDVSAEEEIKTIREARTSGKTRELIDF